jgi:hypothetical protein
MNYTLDSVQHAIECLREKLNIQKISKTALVCGLDELTEKNNNTYYFGVLNIGENVTNCQLQLFGMNFIDIPFNNQIICLFDNIDLSLNPSSETSIHKGQFRGFILVTEPSGYIGQ